VHPIRRKKIANIKEVADLAGVSTTTVSHVINRTRFVSDKARKNVLDAIEQLRYKPNGLSKIFRQKKTKTIGLIVPDITNPYFADIARSIENECYDLGHSVILCNSDNSPEKESKYLDVFYEKAVDGMLLVATSTDNGQVAHLQQLNIPGVLVDREIPGINMDSVMVDNYFGGKLAAEYLIKLGHRKIACISGPLNAQRVQGFKEAFDSAHIPFIDANIIQGDFSQESGYQAFVRIMQRKSPPTAVFACNDMMAVGLLKAAHEMKIKIPEDLSVIGFG